MKLFGFLSKDGLDKGQAIFDHKLSMLSEERQAEVKSQRQEVEDAMDYENGKMSKQFAAEEQMRVATGLHHVDAEKLMYAMKTAIDKGTLKVGQIYMYKGLTFVWTPYKTIVKADLYISSLQDAVIKLTGTFVETPSFTNLGFLDLIKLAFKRLFKRG